MIRDSFWQIVSKRAWVAGRRLLQILPLVNKYVIHIHFNVISHIIFVTKVILGVVSRHGALKRVTIIGGRNILLL